MPPRAVSFSIEVSAEGYETFAKTAEHDMSQALVVSKWVRLTPKPRIAPTPTPRPAPLPSEPPPPEPSRRPSRRPRRSAAPETPSPEACMARYRPRLEEVRAHNRRQDPTSGTINTMTMGTDAACSAAYSACLAAVQERAGVLPAGAGPHLHAVRRRREPRLD